MEVDERENSNVQQVATRWWQRLVEAAAAIALPAAIAYGVGVLALWMQIVSSYSFSLGPDVAWFAATIASRSLVINVGVGILVRTVGFSFFVAFVIFLVAYILKKCSERKQKRARDQDEESVKDEYAEEETPDFAFIVPSSFFILGPLLTVLGYGEDTLLIGNVRLFVILICAYVFLVSLLIILPLEGRQLLAEAFGYFSKSLYLVTLLCTAVVLTLCILFPGNLQLPCLMKQESAEIIEGREQVSFSPEGRFVSFREGSWYVINEQSNLEAIPAGSEGRFTIEDVLVEVSSDIKPQDDRNESLRNPDNIDDPINDCF